MKTYSQKGSEIKREWWVIDASTMPLGKLAVVIADKLMGKSKVTYTPHIDNGDYVVVVNAKNLVVTGDKMVDKKYYRHTGYVGGIKEATAGKMMNSKPEDVFKIAVKGMLPKNSLGRQMLSKLKIYKGSEHPHSAQNPKPFSL